MFPTFCNSVQCSAVQCIAVQCSAVQCIVVKFNVVLCSVVQLSAVQCSAMQCSEVQCSANKISEMKCSVVQCSDESLDNCTKLGGQGANCQQIRAIDRCVAINMAIIAITTDLTVQGWSTVKCGEGGGGLPNKPNSKVSFFGLYSHIIIFKDSALGRFFHMVAMSVCISVVPFHVIFFLRPRTGVERHSPKN